LRSEGQCHFLVLLQVILRHTFKVDHYCCYDNFDKTNFHLPFFHYQIQKEIGKEVGIKTLKSNAYTLRNVNVQLYSFTAQLIDIKVMQ